MTEQTLTPALHPTLNLPLPVKQPLPLTALSDEQLVHLLAEGRALSASEPERCASLLVIYDRHYPLCFAFALRLVNSPELAESVVHSVYLELWHNSPNFKVRQGSLRSWLLDRVLTCSLTVLRQPEATNGFIPVAGAPLMLDAKISW